MKINKPINPIRLATLGALTVFSAIAGIAAALEVSLTSSAHSFPSGAPEPALWFAILVLTILMTNRDMDSHYISTPIDQESEDERSR